MTDTHLRFDGWLGADDRFERIPGWETEDPLRARTGDGEYRLVVRDREGERLAAVSPRTQSGTVCAPNTRISQQETRITGYVPLVEGAHTVALVDDDGTLTERHVAPEPPTVEITGFEHDGDEVSLTWTSDLPRGQGRPDEEREEETGPEEHGETERGERDSDRRLTHHVGVLAGGAVSPLAFGVDERRLEASLAAVPGDDEARVLVVATDGLRSTTAETEPFAIDDPGPTVDIQRPTDAEVLPADQPVSLSGQVQDAHGRSLSATGMRWQFDGEVVATDAATAVTGPPAPGEHTVTLTYEPPAESDVDEPVVRERSITIQNRTDRQQWYREVMPEERTPDRQ